MLAEMIDKIVELRKTQTFEIDGRTYTDKPLQLVKRVVDAPSMIDLTGLDSVCKMIRKEIGKVGHSLIVQVDSYKSVKVFSEYIDDFSRFSLYRASADIPGFREGWRDYDEAIIALRSLFIPNEGSQYLLGLLSRITSESSASTSDNGVTQDVVVRKGIALNEKETIKPRVSLKPFRTFLEVEQPESEFLIRINDEKRIGFFEADGGVWKLEAKRNVAAYFMRELSDLIATGDVIVTM